MRDSLNVGMNSLGDDVLELVWDRRKSANAFDEALVEDLLTSLAQAADMSPKLLVLRGAGGRFSAGFDLRGDDDDRLLAWRFARAEEALAAVRQFPAVTVARVEGPAFGMGADLVAACDYRLGTAKATLRFPGSRFGVVLGTHQLRERVGAFRATDILVRNEVVRAEEALRDGLLTHVLEAAEQHDFVEKLAADVLDLDSTTLVRLLAVLRSDNADSSAAALARSTHRQGLADRVESYREAALLRRADSKQAG